MKLCYLLENRRLKPDPTGLASNPTVQNPAHDSDSLVSTSKSATEPAENSPIQSEKGHHNFFKMIHAKLNWTQENMENKIILLEESLNFKKEDILDKEIVLEELSKMTAGLKEREEATKNDSLKTAMDLNSVKMKFGGIVRKMMAVVSEVSVYQAKALGLKDEIDVKVQRLEGIDDKMQMLFNFRLEEQLKLQTPDPISTFGSSKALSNHEFSCMECSWIYIFGYK